MNDDTTEPEPRTNTVSFIRHPIFKEKKQLWGYQIGCVDRSGDASHRLRTEGDLSQLVASSSYIGLEKLLTKGKRLMISSSHRNILDTVHYAMPASFGAVKVNEQELMDSTVLPDLEKLKADGYLLAIGHFSGDQKLSAHYALADIFCMETAAISLNELKARAAAADSFSAQLMGEQVMDVAQFEQVSELGFTLFQGPFFKTPEMISVRKISSNEAARFQLLKLIETQDPDFEKLAKAIQTDVSISLRLLTYLNSASFGLPRKISSIQQAVAMLGWQNLKKWLRVVLLSDVSQNTNAQELIALSSLRGHFLETLVREHDFWGFSPDAFFMLGIFSLLDTLLGMPMQKVVEHLPLDDKIKAALCRDTNSEYFPLLQLAEHLEEGDWPKADQTIQRLSMNDQKVKSAFHDAVNWANEIASLHS